MPYLNESKVLTFLNEEIDILALISDRGGRKSSVIQNIVIKDALRGHPFILVRNKSDVDISETWFSDYILKKYENLSFRTERINRYITAIFITKNEKDFLLCYTMYLSLSEKYKSNYMEDFEKVKYIIWEECVQNKPMIQSSQYVRQRMLDDLINLMSIKSTVCRRHKAQLILLGNDISVNLINPVTVTFNLLERLTVDQPIYDNVEIDDRKYRFCFYYFSFPNSVEHWFVNRELDVDNSVEIVEKQKAFDMILISEFKRYYVYKMKNFLYVSSKFIEKEFLYCQSAEEFFKKYHVEHLLKNFSVDLALQMIVTTGICTSYDVSYYFGDRWYIKPEFRTPVHLHTDTVVNLVELSGMKNNQIVESANYSKLKQLGDLIAENTVIYENCAIKLLLQEFSLRMVLL